MKVAFDVADLTRWTSGSLVQGRDDVLMRGVSIDSRQVGTGELFVAIVGPTHDGHRFCAGAAQSGAACLLVNRDHEVLAGLCQQVGDPVAIVAVDDTTAALGALGAGHRAGFSGPVVAITGSNGKTTTKEMCASILSIAGPCHRTPGNLNNQFGLPLTLLGRDERDHAMVVELGMNHRGEIAVLAELAQPTVAMITNIGSAHIEYLGSREEIAMEKGDLLVGLSPSGTAVLNADDPAVMSQAGRTAAKILTFGTNASADVRAEEVTDHARQGYAFRLVTPAGERDVTVHGLGPTTIINALAAAAAAFAAGAGIDAIAAGLAQHAPVAGRLQQSELAGDIVLIDDTYNANPQSTEAALRTLAEHQHGHRRIAVLGDMGELGDASAGAHREAGRLTAELGIDFLIAMGEHAETVASGALDAGLTAQNVFVSATHQDAIERANEILMDRDIVLVKGSRSMRMERVVEGITSARMKDAQSETAAATRTRKPE